MSSPFVMSSPFMLPASSPSDDAYLRAAQEDRCTPRTRLSIPATLRLSGKRPFHTTVLDLSAAGFAAGSIHRLHAGTLCWLTLPGLEALRAEVMWWDAGVAGCAFMQLLSPLVQDALLARWAGGEACAVG